jgi:hypothetical protein
LTGTAAFLAPFGQEAAPRIEFLNPVVALVGHVDVADEIHRDAARKEKSAVKAPIPAPLEQRRPVRFEFLNPRIAGVRNVEIPFTIRRHAPRHVELAHVRPTPGKPELAPGLHRRAVRVQLLNPVVAAVRDIDVPLGPGGQPAGIVELPLLRAGIAAPPREEFAVPVELLNGMVVRVGHVDVPVLVERNAGGRTELSLVHALLPDRLHDQVGRGNRHHLRRLRALALRRHHGDHIVVAGAVGQIVVHVGRGDALDAVPLFLLHPHDRLEVVGAGDGTGQVGVLDLHALVGQEVEVVVHGLRNGIPRNRDLPVARRSLHIGRRGRQVLFGRRFTRAPFVGMPLGEKFRAIQRVVIVEFHWFHSLQPDCRKTQ